MGKEERQRQRKKEINRKYNSSAKGQQVIRQWFAANRATLREKQRARYHEQAKDPAFLETERQRNRARYSREKDRAKAERHRLNPTMKLRMNLRKRFWAAVKNEARGGSAVRDLGCSIDQFKLYIEGQFREGMSWDNWGVKGWHLDHIRPLSGFDLTDRDQFLMGIIYLTAPPF